MAEPPWRVQHCGAVLNHTPCCRCSSLRSFLLTLSHTHFPTLSRAGERLCPLGANNVAALSSTAAAATASAHSGLQQQLQAAMAVDAAVLTARAAPQPSPSVLAATKLLPPAVATAGGGEGAQ